jgi:glucokinase
VGEGGHMSASAANAREWKIIQHIYDGGATHVSWERLLSGYGLPTLHAAVCAVDGLSTQALTAEQIGTLAKSGEDEGCVATVHTFSALLGSFAADMALAFGATGGAFIAGGIVPKLGQAFSVASFRERFEAKGRFKAYLSPIPTYLIKSPYPAFLGLASLVEA